MRKDLTFKAPAGTFVGYEDEGTIQIKGIRYADSVRYDRPVLYHYGSGNHLMMANAPFGIQAHSVAEYDLQGTRYEDFPQVENDQYLSITRPLNQQIDEKLPVMVWFHGGSYRNGGADGPSYDRKLLVKENGVIVVGVNYRLGLLGFSRDREGNYANNGLLDAITSLKWLQENIVAFGGDPDNVTIFGQSAGADMVRGIILASGTANLYHRAIMQSDPIGSMKNREKLDAQVLELINQYPIDAPTSELLKIQLEIQDNITEKGLDKFLIFAPHYGIYPLPTENEIPTRLKAVATDHKLLIGATTREAAIVLGTSEKLAGLHEKRLTKRITERFIKKMSHAIFIDPSLEFAQQYAQAGGTVYHYAFSWLDDQKTLGAMHIADLAPLFGLGQAEGLPVAMGYTQAQVVEAGRPMRQIWTTFAAKGIIKQFKINQMLTIEQL